MKEREYFNSNQLTLHKKKLMNFLNFLILYFKKIINHSASKE